MSDPNILVSANESIPHKGLEVSEGFEASDVDSEQENKCRHCFPNKLHQEINEDESEKKNGPQVLDGKDIVSPDPLVGQEELALQWHAKEDMGLQQWSDGSIYRGNITMNMKLGVGEFRWANGESYIGEFYKDHHHGKGIYYWPDGCKFTGFFYLSRKEGYGTMTFPDGKSYQGLYKSDVRYGPGFETHSDGCQDVGIWKGQQLFRLCTVVPGSISTLSYPQFSQPQKTNKRCVSEDHDSVTEKRKTEDPFLFRYKFLLLDDRFTLPEKIYSYSSDTDHLPITPTEHREFNQHFYRDKDQQEVCSHVTFDNVQPNSGMRKIYLHVNEHRHSPQHLKWGIISIMNGERYKFGPIGPRERVAEQLIVAAGLGDYDAICTILRHDLAHVDVSDKFGLTALQAAAVNGHNNVINLLLDNGADVNKSNDEGLSALSLCLMLFYSSKPFWPNVAERNLPFSKFPSTPQEWQTVASHFASRWDFPNCGGAIDGKHVHIVPPPHSGSYYFNYKGFHSIVLMAVVSAHYDFLYVDVGKNGRMSDGGVFAQTEFCQRLQSGGLGLPPDEDNVEGLPFVFIADEAFALSNHLMRPFPQRTLTPERRVFNYRLARARRVVENAFGILASRFRLFQTAINLAEYKLNFIILTCCILHNFLNKHSANYIGTVGPEAGQIEANLTGLDTVRTGLAPQSSRQVRQQYVNYFMGRGAIAMGQDI